MKQFQHLCYTAMSATTARTLYPHFVTWRPAQTPVTSPASPPSPHSQSSRVSSSLSSASSSQNCWSVSWVWKCAVCNLKSLLVLKNFPPWPKGFSAAVTCIPPTPPRHTAALVPHSLLLSSKHLILHILFATSWMKAFTSLAFFQPPLTPQTLHYLSQHFYFSGI